MTQTFLSLRDLLLASLPSRSATKRDLIKLYNMYFSIITINTSPQVKQGACRRSAALLI